MEAGTPWVEKYRPRRLAEIAQQEDVIRTLTTLLSASTDSGEGYAASLPHLLFYGPPGTGKTSTALALCRELFGEQPQLWRTRVLELNASDERGIQVVREKIKRFAKASVEQTGAARVAAFKVIILDEADNVTADAQTALRRTIEKYSRTTRFILIGNYVSRIIPPLASRCAKFRFRPLSADGMKGQLRHVAEREGLGELDEAVLDVLVRVSGGDLRRAVMALQSCQCSAAGDTEVVTPAAAMEAACLVPPPVLQQFLDACWAPAPPTAATTDQATRDEDQRTLFPLLLQGYPADALLQQTFEALVLGSAALDDGQRAAIAIHLAETDKCLADGADETLQLLAFTQYAQQIAAAESAS